VTDQLFLLSLVIFDAYSKSDSYDFENDIISDPNYNFIKNIKDSSEIINILKDTIKKCIYSFSLFDLFLL
jgi:hypothetical protein